MKLTRVERWIISNQMQILSIIDPDQKADYVQTKKIVDEGFELLYNDCVQGIASDEYITSEQDSELVLSILSMFRGITFSLSKIEDKSDIDVQALKFNGFDATEESKYYYFAKFFCTEFDGGTRFSEIGTGDDNYNSHYPALEVYIRMLEVWETCVNKHSLTKDELNKIAYSTIHPANR